jgi:hypothetical protein
VDGEGAAARERQSDGWAAHPPPHVLLAPCDEGSAALSIQKLAGHEDLQTTLGYMHLAVGETDRAIRLLEEPHGHVNTASIQQAPGTN